MYARGTGGRARDEMKESTGKCRVDSGVVAEDLGRLVQCRLIVMMIGFLVVLATDHLKEQVGAGIVERELAKRVRDDVHRRTAVDLDPVLTTHMGQGGCD